MLHENPLMTDIDVNHWRNMQQLILESSKPKRRIIVIHENGEIMKFIHSQRLEIAKNVDFVDNPKQVAEKIFKDNADVTDFVMVLNRKSVEKFFAGIQDSWTAAEDLDAYVHRMFASLEDYPDGIATYPGEAGTNLGLQWRLGTNYEAVEDAVSTFVVPDSTVFFGVFEGNTLWGSLVLGFDTDKKINIITTADPSELKLVGDWKQQAAELVNWINKKFPKCSIGIFTDLEDAKQILKSKEKLTSLLNAKQRGKMLVEPMPQALEQLLG